MDCIWEAISLKKWIFRSYEKDWRALPEFHRQTMTYSGVNITKINYYFPKKQEMTDDHWGITMMSINWILEQKPERVGGR